MAVAPETYELLTSPGTNTPDPQNEGTNAVRLAMMASLVPPVVAAGAPPQPLIEAEELEEVGLNPELVTRITGSGPPERLGKEADFLRGLLDDGFDAIHLRSNAFTALSTEAHPEARLAFLASGLSSRLERESATAASAILSSVPAPDAPRHDRPRLGWPYRFLPRYNSFRFAGLHADFVTSPDEDGVPAEPLQWDGAGWERYSAYVMDGVLRENSPADLREGLRFLAQVRVDLGQQSGDPIVRELSFASHLSQQGGDALPPTPPGGGGGSGNGDGDGDVARPSTMVHGTWGWKGSWWYPGGDFHSFVTSGIRPDLYAGGQEFSWSGAYSNAQRTTGGDRFARWAATAGGSAGLGTVFAHSYGSEVVARAVNAGTKIDEVVLLSAPINAHHKQMLSAVRSIIDVRLKFDIVLLAARARQKLPAAPNVTEFVLDGSYWSHSATHDPQVWTAESIATTARL